MLGDYRLAGERRLVNLQVGRLYQRTVGGYLVTHFDDYYVAHDDVLARHFHYLAVTAHLYGRLFAKGGEHVELLCRVHLEPEADCRGQDDGQDNAHALDKLAVDASQGQRDYRRYE